MFSAFHFCQSAQASKTPLATAPFTAPPMDGGNDFMHSRVRHRISHAEPLVHGLLKSLAGGHRCQIGVLAPSSHPPWPDLLLWNPERVDRVSYLPDVHLADHVAEIRLDFLNDPPNVDDVTVPQRRGLAQLPLDGAPEVKRTTGVAVEHRGGRKDEGRGDLVGEGLVLVPGGLHQVGDVPAGGAPRTHLLLHSKASGKPIVDAPHVDRGDAARIVHPAVLVEDVIGVLLQRPQLWRRSVPVLAGWNVAVCPRRPEGVPVAVELAAHKLLVCLLIKGCAQRLLCCLQKVLRLLRRNQLAEGCQIAGHVGLGQPVQQVKDCFVHGWRPVTPSLPQNGPKNLLARNWLHRVNIGGARDWKLHPAAPSYLSVRECGCSDSTLLSHL
mmetsp:Transcript_24316/g.67608  ORF Transcript_24316/g.67608 Transcript_24316/m.67608 type:complete len:382 (-) Transcript_24316:149-1294(-)